MVISSRTPEGDAHRCPVCGRDTRTDPSTVPTRDAPCPHCGSLLWFDRGTLSSLAGGRKRVNRLVEEIAQLVQLNLAPPAYYAELLQRLLAALAAPAGAVWCRTGKENLELQAQANLHCIGLDQSNPSRAMHDELLRQAFQGQPLLVPPHWHAESTATGRIPAGNGTGYVVLIAPFFRDRDVARLIEVWQDPERSPEAQRGFLNFLTAMARHASYYAGKAAHGAVEA